MKKERSRIMDDRLLYRTVTLIIKWQRFFRTEPLVQARKIYSFSAEQYLEDVNFVSEKVPAMYFIDMCKDRETKKARLVVLGF